MPGRRTILNQFGKDTVKFLRRVWLPVMVVILTVRIIVAMNDSFDTSVWSAAAVVSDLLFWPFGGWVLVSRLPECVAHGVTRRRFATNLAWFMVGISIAMGSLITALYGLEHVIYNAVGITDRLGEVDAFYSPEQVGMTLVAYSLTHAAHVCSGMLIASSIWRFGWRALLLVPFCLIPPYVAEFMVDTQWGRWLGPNSEIDAFYLGVLERATFGADIPFLIGALLSIIVIGVGAYIAGMLLSSVDITRLDDLKT